MSEKTEMERELARRAWRMHVMSEALRDIASHDLMGLTGPAKIVAEAMRNRALEAINDETVKGDTAS